MLWLPNLWLVRDPGRGPRRCACRGGSGRDARTGNLGGVSCGRSGRPGRGKVGSVARQRLPLPFALALALALTLSLVPSGPRPFAPSGIAV
eukprot:10246142-Alexandrium_andersonii.AAC.1